MWGARRCAGALRLRGLGELRQLRRLQRLQRLRSGAQHPARATPAVAAPSTTAFGATVNTLFNAPLYTPEQVSAELAALRATGATLARSDVLWEKIEPGPPSGGVHHYDWTFDDGIAGALAAHRLTWLPILDYAANWAKADPTQLHSPPKTPADFAGFAAAFAARYGPGGAFWRSHLELPAQPVTTFEVWNEPDNDFFWYPAANAAAFAELYLETRRAIDAVAPGSRVVIGGLTRAQTSLPAMLAAQPQLARDLDGVALHLYGPAPARVFDVAAAVRATMRTVGLGAVPLYITEVGWSTQPVGRKLNEFYAPARLRPGYIARSVRMLGRSDCGVGAILVYSWVTGERDPANPEDWYGIHPPPPGTGASPDTQAFTRAIRAASTPGPPAHVCGGA